MNQNSNIDIIGDTNNNIDDSIISNKKNSNKNINIIKQFKCKNVYITGFLCGILALLLNTILINLFSYLFNKSDNDIDNIKASIKKSSYIYITGMCIFAPIIEELIFRRIIFYFISKWNLIAGYLISSFLFSMYHFGFFNLLAIINKWNEFIIFFIMGNIFAYAYDHDRCILASMIAHSINNTIVLLLAVML